MSDIHRPGGVQTRPSSAMSLPPSLLPSLLPLLPPPPSLPPSLPPFLPSSPLYSEIATFFNFAKASIGSGSFALPWGILQAGVVVGSFGMVLLGIAR